MTVMATTATDVTSRFTEAISVDARRLQDLVTLPATRETRKAPPTSFETDGEIVRQRQLSRIGKITLVVITLGATLSLWASPSMGAPDGDGPDKLPVWTSNRLVCGKNAAGKPVIGSVVIKADDDTITAQVTLKDGIPNFKYEFQLLEWPASRFGCFGPPDATLTTNGKGDGNVRITQRRSSGATGAWILALPAGKDNVLSPVSEFGAK
jgi:hypothetical protein